MQLNFDEMRGNCGRGLDTQPTSGISMPKHFQGLEGIHVLMTPFALETMRTLMSLCSHASSKVGT
jgi:hypothetical protein